MATVEGTGSRRLDGAALRAADLAGRLRGIRTKAAGGHYDRWLLVIGGILMPLGVLLILLGWYGAARTPLPFEQTDYLISGGILGLSFVVGGGFVYFAYWQTLRVRESRIQARELAGAMRSLELTITGIGAGGAAPGTLRPASLRPAASRANETTGQLPALAADSFVATPTGSIFHRPECQVVAGRGGLLRVDPETTTLRPCRILRAAGWAVSWEQFHALAAQVNNWGRWGSHDERGTLNLITAEHVRAAAELVCTGRTVPLSIPLSEDGPQLGFVKGRTNPALTMAALFEPLGDPAGVRFNDDAVTMGLQAATHWDALGHVSYQDRLYNGFDPSVVTEHGAAHLGAERLGSIVGRGVLLDLAAAAGRGRLSRGRALTPEDLEAAERFGRVSVGTGDIVLVRTGQMQLLRAGDRMGYNHPTTGPSLQTVRWFHERGVAAVATDTLAFEVFPGEDPDLVLPVHMLHVVEMGLVQGQNFDLEELSAACADDGRYAFLLDATPVPFRHGLGAPVSPVALK